MLRWIRASEGFQRRRGINFLLRAMRFLQPQRHVALSFYQLPPLSAFGIVFKRKGGQTKPTRCHLSATQCSHASRVARTWFPQLFDSTGCISLESTMLGHCQAFNGKMWCLSTWEYSDDKFQTTAGGRVACSRQGMLT